MGRLELPVDPDSGPLAQFACDLRALRNLLVAVGYGSGDAAESIPITAVPGYEQAARRIMLKPALARAIDLNREQYEALHDGREVPGLTYAPQSEFVITHVGERYDASFQDLGVEYYSYVG